MQKLHPIWTVMLVLILLMGAMPLILAAIGYVIVFYVDNFGTRKDLTLLDWGMRMRFLTSYALATIPAALISTAVWVFVKSVLSKPPKTDDDSKEAL